MNDEEAIEELNRYISINRDQEKKYGEAHAMAIALGFTMTLLEEKYGLDKTFSVISEFLLGICDKIERKKKET